MRLILLLTLIFAKPVWTQMVIYPSEKGQAIIIKASYDNVEPISYAEVKIFSLEKKKIEYQIGRTDANDCFAFLPFSAGVWKVILSDGIGHGFVTEAVVNEGFEFKPIRSGWSRMEKLIVVISFFIGFITAYLISKRIELRRVCVKNES